MIHFAKQGIHLKYLPAINRILVEGTVEKRTANPVTGKITLASELFEVLSWEMTLPKDSWHFARTIELKPCEKWSVDHPVLYDVRFQLEAGTYSDTITLRYGIRSFKMEDGFSLNGVPVKLKGACGQELKELKKVGFNLIRIGGTPFSPEFLDLCDELGLLVIGEFDLARMPEHEVSNAVLCNRSHPCVVLWNLEHGSEKAAELIRLIDTERPVTCGLTGTAFANAFSKDER